MLGMFSVYIYIYYVYVYVYPTNSGRNEDETRDELDIPGFPEILGRPKTMIFNTKL